MYLRIQCVSPEVGSPYQLGVTGASNTSKHHPTWHKCQLADLEYLPPYSRPRLDFIKGPNKYRGRERGVRGGIVIEGGGGVGWGEGVGKIRGWGMGGGGGRGTWWFGAATLIMWNISYDNCHFDFNEGLMKVIYYVLLSALKIHCLLRFKVDWKIPSLELLLENRTIGLTDKSQIKPSSKRRKKLNLKTFDLKGVSKLQFVHNCIFSNFQV